jgi:predicted PurR-regulated permease PerM
MAVIVIDNEQFSVFGFGSLMLKVTLKLIMGPFWMITGSGLQAYLSRISKISQYNHPLLQPFVIDKDSPVSSTVDALTDRISKKKTSVYLKYEERLKDTSKSSSELFKSSTEEFDEGIRARSRSVKLTEDIKSTLYSSESGPYFELLFRGIILYLSYLFVVSLGLYNWLFIGFMLLILASLHIMYHLALYIFQKFRFNKKSKLFSKKKTAVSGAIVQKMAQFISKNYKNIRRSFRDTILARIDSVVTIMMVLSVLVGSITFSIFFVVKVSHETNVIMESIYSNLNTSINIDPEMQVKLHEYAKDLSTYATLYMDGTQIDTSASNNVTIMQLYSTIQSLYQIYAATPESSSKNLKLQATATIMKAVSSFDVKQITNTTLLTNVYAELRDEFRSLFDFNYTKALGIDSQVLMSSSTQFISYFTKWISQIFNLLLFGFQFVFELSLFLATLYYLLSSEHNVLYTLSQAFQMFDMNLQFTQGMEKAIHAVFLSTFKMALFHSLFSWLTFSAFNISFTYIGTFLSGITAMVPILSPLVIALPAIFELYYIKGQRIAALLMAALHIYANWFIDPAIYADIPDSHPYFSALGVVLGIYAFGMEGVVIGPLLACIPVMIYHIAIHITEENNR